MMPDKRKEQASLLEKQLHEARSSINVLFLQADSAVESGLAVIDIRRKPFILEYLDALNTTIADLRKFIADTAGHGNERFWQTSDPRADSIDNLNRLAARYGKQPLARILEQAVFESLFYHDMICRVGTDDFAPSETGRFMLLHAERVCRSPQTLKAYLALMGDSCPEKSLPRLRPDVVEILSGKPVIEKVRGKAFAVNFMTLAREFAAPDIFDKGRTYRYADEQFTPANLSWIRKTDDFFGYHGVRNLFEDYYSSFVQGRTGLPLLVSSLPGLGKTHFAIAYALARPELTLILVGPDDLEKGFEPLIGKLASRRDRRFVLFFDDIDPGKINWYYFRTNVGGSLALPDNISVVIASNHEFPANILSRGRAIKFPMFDEIRCMEMIEEFLKSRGMKHCSWQLVSIIATDYLEEFSQHKFEELSPRTLLHYLEIYGRDIKRRKRILEMSRSDVIPKPDPQIFYEFNIKLMKILYGEEILDVLREERLKQEIGII